MRSWQEIYWDVQHRALDLQYRSIDTGIDTGQGLSAQMDIASLDAIREDLLGLFREMVGVENG